MGTFSDGIKKEWRLIVFILTIIVGFWLLWALRSILLPFVLGTIFAFILLPYVHWIEKHLPGLGNRKKLRNFLRISTILVVYILILGIIGLLVFYIVYMTRQTLGNLQVDISTLVPNALDTVQKWLNSLPFLSSVQLQATIDNYFHTASDALPGLFTDFVSGGFKILQTSADTIISFIVTPVFMFFILKDWERIRDSFYGSLSPWLRKRTKGFFNILQNVILRYVRGQFILGLVVGILSYIMLLILRIEFALPLAIFSGITELVPMVGPWIGGALGILVTLAVAPEKIIWVALGYLAVQLLENNLLVPRVQGTQMKIHPAFVIVLTLLGAYFAGILGFIIILPVTMLIISLFRYFRDDIRQTRLLEQTGREDFLSPDEM